MARELTNGFPLAAQIPEGFISRVFRRAFLQALPTTSRAIGGRTIDVWFDVPTARIVRSPNPLQNLIEVAIPLTARLSDRWDETRAVFTARPSLIQVEVVHGGATLIAPMVDFRTTAPDAFAVQADVDAYREPLLTALTDTLRALSPFTAAPLFPSGGRQFFLRNYETESGSSTKNILAIFITDGGAAPSLPATVEAHASGDGVAVLVPRDVVDGQIAAGLAANGLGALPANVDDVTLNSLGIELKRGHIFISGSATAEVGPFSSDVDFKAWTRLFVEDDAVSMSVARTEQDGDALADLVDFFSAGAVTRTLEEAIPRAVRSVGGSAFGSVGLFARDVPTERAFAAARAFGSIGITPDGLKIPVQLVDQGSPATVAPPYLRAHQTNREFHVVGCEFGDKIRRPRRFARWQAAVAAGYNGCWTCQRDYNVVAGGHLIFKLSGPPPAEVPGPQPVFQATFTGAAERFGVPIGPLSEKSNRVRGHMADGQLVYIEGFDHLVPGAWQVTIDWDGWSVTGNVDVRRHWTDANGQAQGNRTWVKVQKGQPTFEVEYD